MSTVYLSIPIRFREYAERIEQFLGGRGIKVLNPCAIVHKHYAKEDIPGHVARACWKMIKDSDAVILYTDYYGRDCAAEVGYATALGKPIFPFYFFGQASFLQEDWMIKSSLEQSSDGLDRLVERIFSRFPQSNEDGVDETKVSMDQIEFEEALHT